MGGSSDIVGIQRRIDEGTILCANLTLKAILGTIGRPRHRSALVSCDILSFEIQILLPSHGNNGEKALGHMGLYEAFELLTELHPCLVMTAPRAWMA